ncbi:hypothetical protein Pcinc_008781 [Petrolisthes cinctipes]|uniref:Uncharacterized protein n=1 Tax=Petrolisthes cinctipes TaxID=88211 RepID=A0AAE1KW47_PETCI|nr:hypothetical protein Pcinc_008781 [Petrolisthes cinctipes]
MIVAAGVAVATVAVVAAAVVVATVTLVGTRRPTAPFVLFSHTLPALARGGERAPSDEVGVSLAVRVVRSESAGLKCASTCSSSWQCCYWIKVDPPVQALAIHLALLQHRGLPLP